MLMKCHQVFFFGCGGFERCPFRNFLLNTDNEWTSQKH